MRKKFLTLFLAIAFLFCLGNVAFAVNTHSEFIEGAPVASPVSDRTVYIQSNTLDFSGLTIYGTGGVTTADVVQLLPIKGGTIVLDVGIYIDTATATGGVTGTATIGDGSDVDGWITSFDIGSSASGVSSAVKGTGAYAHGKYYSADDTIDMVIPTLGTYDFIEDDPESILTDFVIRAWAICIKPSTQKAYGKLTRP